MRHVQALRLAALSLLLAASGAVAQGKPRDLLKIATEGAYAPWNFSTASGKLDGFEIELANDLCSRMKVKCEVVAQDWDGLIPGLNAAKYDAIMAGMQITDKRLEAVAFSRPYARTPGSFLVRKDSPLAKAPDDRIYDVAANPAAAERAAQAARPHLAGKIVGVQAATTAALHMERLFPGIQIREYKSGEQLDLDLAAGRVDAAVAATTALDATKQKPGFEDFVVVGPSFTGGYLGRGVAVALRKADHDLKAMFDDAIASALADGTLSRLSRKWFGRDLAAP
jgi:octopine/nopaline transport system substrate-binding protein